MSSHHFVKEKQEPALFIHSEQSLNLELLGQLLEWSPYVIADEHVLYCLNHEPIKLDLVIQQILSDEEMEEWTANQSDLTVLKLSSTEDKLMALVKHLEKEQHKALSLLACSDEHVQNLDKLATNLDIIQYAENYKGYFMKHDFKKWKARNAVFEIFDNPIETKNLIFCNHNTWKVVSDGLVEINLNKKTYIKEYSLDN
jgi:hypothetical protein